MKVSLLHLPENAEELLEIAGRGCYGTDSVDKIHNGYLTIKYNDLIDSRSFILDLGSSDRERLILDDLSKLSNLKTISIKDGRYIRDVEIVKYEPPTSGKFIRNLVKNDHTSVLEHVNATFQINGISRALSHQLVRHRVASYCLSGDTEVIGFTSTKGRSPKRWTLKQLFDWSNDNRRKGRLKLINLRSVDENTGILVPNKIKNIVYSGKQKTFTVKTRCGRIINSTQNHRFFTPTGYKTLSELGVGDKIIANGTPAYKNKEWLKNMYLTKNLQRKEVADLAEVSDACIGVWLKKFNLQKPKSQYPNRQPGKNKKGSMTKEGREIVKNIRLGDKNPMWLGSDASVNAGRVRAQKKFKAVKCETCDTIEGKIIRHHLDEDTHNNNEDNILVLCEPCHKAHHVGGAVLAVYSTPIISIEENCIEDTYDIEMECPHHNFVADGLVVHNSQKSQRYVKEKNFSYFIPEAIKNSKVELVKYENGMLFIDNLYNELMSAGIKKEDARYVLPNACTTDLVATFNLRSAMNIFNLRGDKHAQLEIRRVAIKMLELLKDKCPNVFYKYTINYGTETIERVV